MNIPAFTLARQNAALWPELAPVLEETVRAGAFILGEQVRAFEAELAAYTGSRHAVSVANGSDALYLALVACGVTPGCEVVTTPFTFFATAGAIVRAGATPVFADVDETTFNIDVGDVERRITSRTRAIIPVHLYGQPAAIGPLCELARSRGLAVIEDAAQALGAIYDGRKVCTFGRAACVSFFPTKNLGAFGDAGAVLTDDDEVADRVRALRVHGSRVKYHHEMLGCNSRLDELQAAILRVKLRRIEEWTAARIDRAEGYRTLIREAGIADQVCCPQTAANVRHVFHQYTVRVRERDRLQAYLAEQGIGSAVYYPLPLHLQPVFRDLGYQEGAFPNSERLSRDVLSLPMFPELTESEQQQVVEVIARFLRHDG